MGPSSGPREIRLSTTPDRADLDALELGDIVWLDGLIYTAREGVYMRALDQGAPPARRTSTARPPPISAMTVASILAR